MDEFYNKLILKEEDYKNGLFPQIPNYRKQGSAFILTDGINDNLLVDGYTTTKDIRQGKYSKLVEISTASYMEEIRFESASKESSYTFQVYVKAVIQVKDPIIFYNNKNLDVKSYFTNMFSLDVRKITRKYSILDYDGMDEVLTEKLSSYNNVDTSTGFEYRISVVDAEPSSTANEYVRKNDKNRLDTELRNNARELSNSVTLDYEEAVRTEVVRGNLSEEEAILKIQEFKRADYENQRKQILDLRGDGLITDARARDMMNRVMLLGEPEKQAGLLQGGQAEEDVLDGFYGED